MNETTINVTLELSLAGEALSGRATGPDGRERQFSGWIGLVGVIDSLLGGIQPGSVAAEENPARPEEE